ncbi:hypothetical protein AB0M80_34610 [Amycolatopsis sp. NPDC051045]|uniref:hypothetical protein n=1 Tax=Amycolatopsis sp. NPDC051045 TaxID=3156922 RepID=UPI003414D2D8
MLVVYQLLRTAMADATATRARIDPDRPGFTIAWQAARDQIIQAANVTAESTLISARSDGGPPGTAGRSQGAAVTFARCWQVSSRVPGKPPKPPTPAGRPE